MLVQVALAVAAAPVVMLQVLAEGAVALVPVAPVVTVLVAQEARQVMAPQEVEQPQLLGQAD